MHLGKNFNFVICESIIGRIFVCLVPFSKLKTISCYISKLSILYVKSTSIALMIVLDGSIVNPNRDSNMNDGNRNANHESIGSNIGGLNNDMGST